MESGLRLNHKNSFFSPRILDRHLAQISDSESFGTCQNCVKNNESLATDLRVLIATLLNLECTNDETVGRIFK